MNKIALITGATSGIGRSIALRLGKERCNLIITGRMEERLLELQKEIETKYDAKVLPLTFDVSQYN